MVSSPNGAVSGGAFINTDVSTPTELGFTAGVRAHAEILDGSKGFVSTHFSKAKDVPMALTIMGGNGYSLDASYDGIVNTEVTKTSKAGTAISDASVSASAHVDAVTNHLDGTAIIKGATSNTGIGKASALAKGSASYDVMQTASAPGSTPVKEVYGSVNGKISIQSSNQEEGIKVPEGNTMGSAYIVANSQATDIMSTSNVAISIPELEAKRIGRIGESEIYGVASGTATAGGWDASTPANTIKVRGMDDNVVTTVKGALNAEAEAYAPGDFAAASNKLRAEATNINIGDGVTEAINNADTSVSIVRNNGKFQNTAAHAESSIDKGAFYANGRENSVIPAITFGEASINKIDMASSINAKKVWSGGNSISAIVHGLYDASNTSIPETYLADISNIVKNNGPKKTGSAADSSSAEEHITKQHAEGADVADITIVNLDKMNILNSINGVSSAAGGQTVLGPISAAMFDTTPVGPHTSVTGPVATPNQTPFQNTNVINYEATSFFLRAPG